MREVKVLDLQNTIAFLARISASLDALPRGLPDLGTGQNEGEGAWSTLDVVHFAPGIN